MTFKSKVKYCNRLEERYAHLVHMAYHGLAYDNVMPLAHAMKFSWLVRRISELRESIASKRGNGDGKSGKGEKVKQDAQSDR